MISPYIVSLDFGSTSAKCLIFDSKGKKVAQVNRKWQFPLPLAHNNDQPCFDDQTAWRTIANCCKKAIQDSEVKPSDIACVITTSQRHGAVVLDEEGRALFSFTNADERTAAPWKEIAADHGNEIYHETGRWPQDVFFPAHYFWLKKHHPLIYKKISKILGIQDWLVFRLSNEIVSEVTIASDLLLLNVNKGEWSESIIKLFAIKPSLLPPLVEAGTQVGRVTRAAANDTGLLVGTSVLNGAADSQMALLGLGAINTDDIVATFGTSIPVLLLMDKPVFHKEGATWTNSHVFNNQWVLESNSGDAGHCLNQFQSSLLPELSKISGQVNYEDLPSLLELDALAYDLDESKSHLIASWGPIIFNGKKWPKVRGTIMGLNLLENNQVGVAHLYLSLIENIGFAILGNLQQLTQAVGTDAKNVLIGGPAVESMIWPQLLGNIIGCPIQVPEEKEVTSLGSAILAASKLGFYEDVTAAVKDMVHLSEVQPNQQAADFYRQRYQDWYKVYQFSLI